MKLAHITLVQRLTKHTKALALPFGRRVGQPGHDTARDYLITQMNRIGLEPFDGDSFELSYTLNHPTRRKPQEFTNLVGVIPGRDRSLPPILLGAHYDSVIDSPCVDDNATSVAHNLVLAGYYAIHGLDRDLIIAFFDSEEPPFYLGKTMGSRRFCEDYCSEIDFAAVIVTDLVGHDPRPEDLGLPSAAGLAMPQIKKLVAVMGAESHGAFPEIVEEAARATKDIRVISILHRYVGPMSDHTAFADAGQPFLFLSCGQGEHYHTPEDTIEWINFDKLAHITRFIADLVARIDDLSDEYEWELYDPFDTDIRMLKRALGPIAIAALRAYGIKIPKTREELDELIEYYGQGILQ